MYDQSSGLLTYNPYANMHESVEAKIEWFTIHGYRIRGVIHIGANDGKELAWYVTRGYRPILAFEPHPIAFEELRKHYWNHALLWNVALGANNGQLALNVPEDGNTERASKYYPIIRPGHDWTQVPMTGLINVRMERFDDWVYRGGIDLSPFNAVVIDVQGMELEVLKGFGNFINQFELLSVECSREPVYDGEADANQVIDWLADRCFDRLTPVEEHDDILFCRSDVYIAPES